MKYHWDKKYLYWGVTACCVIAVSILFFYSVFNINVIKGNFYRWINMLMPIIYGFILSYLLSPVLNFLEKHVLFPFFFEKCKIIKCKKNKKRIRALSVFITVLMVILIVIGLFLLLIPQLILSISSLIESFPFYYQNFLELFKNIFIRNPNIESSIVAYLNTVSVYVEKFLNNQLLPQVNTFFVQFSSGLLGFIGVVKNLFIGIIVSIYVMSSKELFAAQSKKFAYAILKPYRANILIKNLRLTNAIFSGFISGKLLDSFIIGMICFAGTKMMNTPYPVLVSVIIGVTNIIPFFGPYLGAIPCALFILLVSPVKVIYFIIFIILLQTFDGNVLGPKILGHSTGLSSFWVIVSILLGGGLFGILGMFIGVPVFAVIYALVKAFINRTLAAHNLPMKTSEYSNLEYIDEDTYAKVYSDKIKDEETKLHAKLGKLKAKMEEKEENSKS
ncbi:MAG: AI-2E family transporter [Lachnotalea sp.]